MKREYWYFNSKTNKQHDKENFAKGGVVPKTPMLNQ